MKEETQKDTGDLGLVIVLVAAVVIILELLGYTITGKSDLKKAEREAGRWNE